MKQGKIIGLTSLIALSGIILVACGTKTSEQKNIKFSIPTDVASLDTTILTDQYSYDVAGNVEEGLTRVDSKGNAALALAKSIDVSKDGLTYTVTLRDNLKWSNGDRLTAKDFVYSWKRAVDPKTGSEYAYLMGAVSGANDIISGKSSLDSLGIKAESDTEFIMDHSCSNQIKVGQEPIKLFQFMPIQTTMISRQSNLNKLISRSFQMRIQEHSFINKGNLILHSFQQLI